MSKDAIPFPNKQYSVIYADPPWEYRQHGERAAINHYKTMRTEEIAALPVKALHAAGGTACFMWATFPNIAAALRVMEAWGFQYKTAAFVWVKKTAGGGNFWGMGAYTRANAEVCLLGVTKDFKAGKSIVAHNVHQIVEAKIREHSRKPDEVRERIVQMMGDVPRIELFARQSSPGWDAWGDEAPESWCYVEEVET